LFSIDPDAHSTAEIDNLQWGVLMARKGGVSKDRVLNALSLDEFTRYLKERKQGTAPRANSRRRSTKARSQGDALAR
jgi:DNA polymerase (family 10)